jgi:hypothetical protein
MCFSGIGVPRPRRIHGLKGPIDFRGHFKYMAWCSFWPGHHHTENNLFHFVLPRTDGYVFLSAATTFLPRRFLRSEGSASDGTLMEVEEAVISRRISDIEYDTTGIEISQLTPKAILTATVRNDSRTHDSKSALQYTYTKPVAGSWTSARTEVVSSKVTFEAKMPTISSTSELGFSESEQHTWGETNTKTIQVSMVFSYSCDCCMVCRSPL